MSTRTQTAVKPAALPARSLAPAPFGTLQRKCACGGSAGSGGECAECKKKQLQRRPANGAQPGIAPQIVHEVLRSPGRQLDAATRASMEPRFRYDFGSVRIHADQRAAESARAVQAHAYTVGPHVVFGTGQYAPGTLAGSSLIAHELTHVVQQRGQAPGRSQLRVGPVHDQAETDAENFAASQMWRAQPSPAAAMLRRSAVYTGRILDEGTCADLVAHSKWICCDPDHGMERKGKNKDVEGNDCPSQKFAPIFTCDHDCDGALKAGCSDSDNWMAIPKGRFTNRKCGQDLVICANGNSTHATVRDKSEIEAWETSRAIPAALGISPDFSGAIYPSESDPDFKKDKRCGAVAAKAAPPSGGSGTAPPAEKKDAGSS